MAEDGITLRPWADEDLPLLHRLLGEPAMMAHLGGPETPEQIVARHARYLAAPGGVFAVVSEDVAIGWVGYWEHAWQGEPAYETGWAVLPEAQGRGIARRATALALERARTEGRHRYVHAFPSVDNAASNALCRRLGFTDRGPVDFEYPKGRQMRCRDWRLDLRA